jgi:hypothetical protein
LFGLVTSVLCLTVQLLFVSSAAASQQVIAYFGTETGTGTLGGQFNEPGDIAVNSTGAGPAGPGEIYVLDTANTRVQRFQQNDNGTPVEPYDDTFEFVSAWGADVVQPGGVGDEGDAATADYEICTVAAQCKVGVRSGGNNTTAGNGTFHSTAGIAVDQDTGRVYVSDAATNIFGSNNRISVYDGDGAFLYSFGYGVDATTPGTGYEVCPATEVCQAGLSGAGSGQIAFGAGIAITPPDGNPTTGTVFLADLGNQRVDTYALDGSSPSSFGSAADFASGAPLYVAVDSRGIVYASDKGNNFEIERYDSEGVDGPVGFLAPIPSPPLDPVNTQTKGLEVDPDSDGSGPEADIFYSIRDSSAGSTVIQQFGPLNPPGLAPPPAAEDDHHGDLAGFNYVGYGGLGFDAFTGRLLVSSRNNIGGPTVGSGANGVYVLDVSGGLPSSAIDSITDITATSATVHGTINPNGGPQVSYSLEYSLDGVDWSRTPSIPLGTQTTDQPVSLALHPPPGGLEPNTLYHVRLLATKAFAPPVRSPEQTFPTLPQKPVVETTGSPVRSATSAQLQGRVNPRNADTTYHFEWGLTDSYGQSTPPQSAGAAGQIELLSQQLDQLQPSSVYHYRLVADNGAPGPPVLGADMTVTTTASDAPLSHGHLPGPPDSDRAWEQVSVPDTGGNPVGHALAISTGGDRIVYRVTGGTPITDVGSAFGTILFSERTPSGWHSRQVTPPRAELSGNAWEEVAATPDLSQLLSANYQSGGTTEAGAIWRIDPAASPSQLFHTTGTQDLGRQFYAFSADATRVIAMVRGASIDPDYPSAGAAFNLYDVSSPGFPHLLSLLPGDTVAACGVSFAPPRSSGWVSADGSRVFFLSAGDDPSCTHAHFQLYIRDLLAGESKLISAPPVSGPTCPAAFIRSTPHAAFFWTQTRLDSTDAPIGKVCDDPSGNDPASGDVYRYNFGDGTLECATCIDPGLPANVFVGSASAEGTRPAPADIAVAPDGSRLYFKTQTRLLSGAPPDGHFAAYRLNLSSGDLAYVGPLGTNDTVGATAPLGNAINPDGSVLIFRSAQPGLNPLAGTYNGGTAQYYRYDDRDRSLICLSCPADGTPPAGPVTSLAAPNDNSSQGITPLSSDGGTFAFATETPLLAPDQNADTDVYEWRDGRLLLITDGLSSWSQEGEPQVDAVSPSGNDVYFTAATQYTADALDAYTRLYDARIGGGFEFPPPPPPCPLEVCQGTPNGAPEEPPPGTSTFRGPGNPPAVGHKCPKRKHRVHGKCVLKRPQKRHKRAHHRPAGHKNVASR